MSDQDDNVEEEEDDEDPSNLIDTAIGDTASSGSSVRSMNAAPIGVAVGASSSAPVGDTSGTSSSMPIGTINSALNGTLNQNSFNQMKVPTYARSRLRVKNELDGAMSAIVTTLPGADLRFLKIRRSGAMRKKVVISFYQERLMREIFTELDFEKNGVISSAELKDASDYVEMRMEALPTTRGTAVDNLCTHVRTVYDAPPNSRHNLKQ